VIALGVMLSLAAFGLLTPKDAFAGFASDTVMMILGLLIMTAGLGQTGVIEIAGRKLLEFLGTKSVWLLPAIMVSVALLSAFISNTAATAFFIPVVLAFAAKSSVSPSRFLMPLAFASILTSSVPLVSTTTNIVVSDLMTRYGLEPMGMFEPAPVGIPIAIVGLIYMLTVGIRLMPDRQEHKPDTPIGQREYQAEIVVLADSPVIGKTVAEARLGEAAGLHVSAIERKGMVLKKQLDDVSLEEGDDLRITGKREDLLKVKAYPGLELRADARHVSEEVPEEDLAIVEGVLLPNSPLIGTSLRRSEFKDRYGLQVLAINRAGRPFESKMSRIGLKLGDVLLLQGKSDDVKALERGNLFSIFGGIDHARLRTERAPLAIGIFVAALALATIQITSLAVAAIGGAFLMLLTRCISPEQAYRQIEWKAIVLIGALLSLGLAMDTSGTGKLIAAEFVAFAGDMPPWVILSCFFVLTLVLTQPMSNQAAAIVVVPVAISTALELGLNPRTFAMMVAVAASCSYLTPLEPSCLMVYGPGKYRFMDFFKVGFPLTIVIFVIAIFLVPVVWPLDAK
jgi:di/tricarboxylate transporter